jgi:tetratricopeptide (TPR) repeat protein
VALAAKGAYRKALVEYQKLLESDPQDVRLLEKMGQMYQQAHDNAQAAHCFTLVAESHARAGAFSKAILFYRLALGLNPNLGEVNLELAQFHTQLGHMALERRSGYSEGAGKR